MDQFRNRVDVLIVDDERRACTNLKNILIEHVDPDLNIIGMAYNTAEAELQISRSLPDAVFLDIEMPNENAFHFLDRIAPFHFEIVFVTSYDEYAVRAFKLNAVDYVLKPLSINDLKNAVQKLREKIRYKRILTGVNNEYTSVSNDIINKTVPNKIILKGANGTEIVDFRNIYCIEAYGSYSKITFVKDNALKEIIMSNALTEYEEMLPSSVFFRIHRSFLVNTLIIKKIINEDIHKVILMNGIELPISRRKYAALLEFLKNNDHLYN